MYSTNGRKNGDKETATTTKSFSSKLICNKCGFVEEERSAVFGEKVTCNSCMSSDTRFEYA